MKPLVIALILIATFTASSYADVCYLLERGSDSWFACKEQAAQNEKEWNKLMAQQAQTGAEISANQSANLQAEQLALILKALAK